MKVELLTNNEKNEIQQNIITRLRDFIDFKNLEPGDKLPSERTLSEKFEVSRSNIRDAIQKLEFFGILNSKPQSGTFIADIGRVAISGMMNDILGLKEPDFKSLMETRILLELKTVRLAALRRTNKNLKKLQIALDAYKNKVIKKQDAVEEDLLFHLAIAKASKNTSMNTFMLVITPEIITNFEKYHVCNSNQSFIGIQEHEDIFQAIKDQNPQRAKQMMKIHFKVLYQYCYNSDN